MAGWNGLGNFTYTYNWVQDNANGVFITDSRMDQEFADVRSGLLNCYTLTGETAPVANLNMGGFKFTNFGTGGNAPNARTDVTNIAVVQDGTPMWGGSNTGTANAIAISPTPGVTALVAGMTLRWLQPASNTGAVTVSVTGLGAVALTRNGGTPMSGAELPAGGIVEAVYDGSKFQETAYITIPGATPTAYGNATTSVFIVERSIRRARQYAAGM